MQSNRMRRLRACTTVALAVLVFVACTNATGGDGEAQATEIVATMAAPTAAPTVATTAAPTAAPTVAAADSMYDTVEHQGFSPYAIAIASDGRYAYVTFDLSEDIFKIRLEDLSVEAVANLSEYFPLQSKGAVLDETEEKLFIDANAWRKLLVLDAQTLSVIHTIDDIQVMGMIRSQHGPYLIAWDGTGTVKLVNTETYEVTEVRDERLSFISVQESQSDPDQWYVASHMPTVTPMTVGLYDTSMRQWVGSVTIPTQAEHEWIRGFMVLPDVGKAYVATKGGDYPDYHSFGWVYSVDLESWQFDALDIDGGALCLEASPDGQRLYVGTGWPVPAVNNLLIIDTDLDSIVGQVDLGLNKYGWTYNQMNDLQIDPSNPDLLYATSSDGNAIIKADLSISSIVDSLVPSNEFLGPRFFVAHPTRSVGHVLIHKSPVAYELDADTGTIGQVVEFPLVARDFYEYDAAIDSAGRLLIPQGNTIVEATADDLATVEVHALPENLTSFFTFVLSHDERRMYGISPSTSDVSDTFVAVDTSDFEVEAAFKLDGGGFAIRPFELPDGSKLYALGGEQNGAVVVHVIETENFTVQKTITFNEPDLPGIAAGPYYPYAYDPDSRTLFVGATYVVLAIDTDVDEITEVIDLRDIGPAMGLADLWFVPVLNFVNAVGLVHVRDGNLLYITHLDRSFVSIYDLNSHEFLPQVIPLNGYFPHYMFANPDQSRIYTLNRRSDSVSVIDVNARALEKVIDLHAYP